MSESKLPKLIVFDLDFTLWPFWVDNHVEPPFKKEGEEVIDNGGKKIKLYEDAVEVLNAVKELNVDMAVASQTNDGKGAEELIQALGWGDFFKYKEMYPSFKIMHFKQLRLKSKVEYEEMLFFDDEPEIVSDITDLNVTCILVEEGMTLKALQEGLALYAEKFENDFI